MTAKEILSGLLEGSFDVKLGKLYGNRELAAQRERYACLLRRFLEEYGNRDAVLCSAPGRTEIGGNHTDHQHGKVLAAAVNLDTVAVAAVDDGSTVRLESEGYLPVAVNLDSLTPDSTEYGTTAALLRGVAAGFRKRGYTVGGFCACVTSSVLSGSGLSSSAAFEVLAGEVFSVLYNEGNVSAQELALVGQEAENGFFGKPCGLMDQMASAVGGLVKIDFSDPKKPVVEKLDTDLTALGCSLCITDTGGSHADLTADYAEIPQEMKAVSAYFGKQYLRDVDEAEFCARLPEVRAKAGDRAVLRALHFFAEETRVDAEADALAAADRETFFRTVQESGSSSYCLLQNVCSPRAPERQGVSVGLAVSERILKGRGAWRVHGGGFAGTIQAFVPDTMIEAYRAELDRVFGAGSCRILRIRNEGGIRIL